MKKSSWQLLTFFCILCVEALGASIAWQFVNCYVQGGIVWVIILTVIGGAFVLISENGFE